MSEKEQLIQAFKSLDFATLRNLLDDNRSYMEVSKELFLSRLEETLKLEIVVGSDSYENVLEGVCGKCNKGCKAYSFTKKNYPSLNLFFEEKQNRVTDIYICGNIKVKNPDDEGWDIDLSFYEEEKVSFKEDFAYLNKLQKIQQATEEFNLIALSAVPEIKDFVYWRNKHITLIDALNLRDLFLRKRYRAYIEINRIYSKVQDLVVFYDKSNYAQEALKEYSNINQEAEKEVVYWLITHENSGLHKRFKETTNWKKTGFIEIGRSPSIVVDCSECMGALLFADFYDTLEKELMEKYKPTREQCVENGGYVFNTLGSFLRAQNKYLDIL